MEIGAQILEKLQREKQMLLEAERITEELQTAPVEELAALTTRRGRFLEEACRLREEEKQLCGADAALLAAWSNAADPGLLAPGARQIYDAAMAVKNVANRIQKNSEPARRRLAHEHQALKEKLEELNSSPARTIERYRHVLQGSEPSGYPGQSRKI